MHFFTPFVIGEAQIQDGAITAQKISSTLKTVGESSISTSIERNNNNNERNTGNISPTKLKEMKINEPTGWMNVRFGLKSSVSGKRVYAQVYINGAAFGTSSSTTGTSYTTFIVYPPPFAANDLLQIYAWSELGESLAYVNNMRLYYDRTGKFFYALPFNPELDCALPWRVPYSVTNQDP